MENEVKEFHRKCGELLSMALHVKSSLDFFISNYFCSPQSYKTFLLSDSILIKMAFERKIKIFEEICKKEEIKHEKFRGVIKSIDFVKQIRNKVAHHEAFVHGPEEGIKLRPRKYSATDKKHELKLTDELIGKVDKNRLSAIQGITKIRSELFKRSREIPNVKEW